MVADVFPVSSLLSFWRELSAGGCRLELRLQEELAALCELTYPLGGATSWTVKMGDWCPLNLTGPLFRLDEDTL